MEASEDKENEVAKQERKCRGKFGEDRSEEEDSGDGRSKRTVFSLWDVRD